MNELNTHGPINDQREEALMAFFTRNIGRRIFIFTEAFPFMFIGTINGMVGDLVVLDVETTSVPALEGKVWNVHLDAIDVFYIETGIGEKIPHLQEALADDVT